MLKKWNQSDTATLLQDQAAGVSPSEIAKKLGYRVGYVLLKAASLHSPFRGLHHVPNRHANPAPIARGPNGVLMAVFDAISQSVASVSPIQEAMERMVAYDEKHNATATLSREVSSPRPAPVAPVQDDMRSPSVGNSPSPRDVAPAVQRPVPATSDVSSLPPKADDPVVSKERRIAYLVAGEDEAIESFRKSVESGIEPSRPVRKPPVVSVAPVTPAVPAAPVVKSEVVKPSLPTKVEPEAKTPREAVASSPVSPAKPAVHKAPVSVPKPQVQKPQAPKPAAPKPQAPTPAVPKPAPTPVKTPQAPVAPRFAEPVRTERPPIARQPVMSPPVAPPRPVVTSRPAAPPVPAVNKPVEYEDEFGRIPVDPETGELLSGEALAERRRRDSLANVHVASRESEDHSYKPTASEKRLRMRQLREAARRVSPPSGRIVNPDEGLRKIMSILG